MAWRWWLIAAVLLRTLTVFHSYCCREHKLSTILIAKAANLARSVTLWLNTLIIQVFCAPYDLYVLLIYGWITIMGYSRGERFEPKSHFISRLSMIVRMNADILNGYIKHKLSTINIVYSLKMFYYPPNPQNCHLYKAGATFFLSPRWP